MLCIIGWLFVMIGFVQSIGIGIDGGGIRIMRDGIESQLCIGFCFVFEGLGFMHRILGHVDLLSQSILGFRQDWSVVYPCEGEIRLSSPS
ncbi:hypothetical protein KC19_2G250800 [Ceratodon purpureus]|uniref:Uncharacterized protein n=1 Tax=Ceratodon purpureus TaxID=3225 RepID=A0A8T0J0K0_CERPU|nr:hypothetical protein KC19_2G250800 [Ceratodon purpureus]